MTIIITYMVIIIHYIVKFLLVVFFSSMYFLSRLVSWTTSQNCARRWGCSENWCLMGHTVVWKKESTCYSRLFKLSLLQIRYPKTDHELIPFLFNFAIFFRATFLSLNMLKSYILRNFYSSWKCLMKKNKCVIMVLQVVLQSKQSLFNTVYST